MEPLKQETSNQKQETPKASNKQLETVLPILGALLLAGGWAPWPTAWLVPLLFIGWVPYLLMERELTRQNARKRRVFALTYLFLVLWNAITTWWVSYAEPTAGAAAVVLGCGRLEWALIVLAVGLVLSVELFNSALETLFHGLDADTKGRLVGVLDIAAGAVLVASGAAVVIGALVFVPKMFPGLAGP